jgi:hypothetical protein
MSSNTIIVLIYRRRWLLDPSKLPKVYNKKYTKKLCEEIFSSKLFCENKLHL